MVAKPGHPVQAAEKISSFEKTGTESFLEIIGQDFGISRGQPLPLGTTLKRDGINFAVFSKHATSVVLVLFSPGQRDPIAEFPLDPRYNRTGYTWHVFVRGLDPGIAYGYRMDRQPNKEKHIQRFDASKILIDPYSKALSGGEVWGGIGNTEQWLHSVRHMKGRRGLIVNDDFDWGFDQPLNTPLSESIIYELHVRGLTHHPSSRVAHPGTYAGLVEKIPYLINLGITAIELLPVNEFEETDTDRVNPVTGERLLNFWGYNSISFFAPKASYASDNKNGAQVKEFKAMVKSMHEAGIEVILDVVFNHTAEGDERGPTLSFRGIDNSTYYIINPDTGAYTNYSGCGNTLNCNHPVVRDLILDCLRYWVNEMHVDGFRFDLASILGRGQDGAVLANPPLLERIAADPVLGNTKIIAEAWDAAGLYQVGTFPAWGRWAEWNGKFRDDIRKFVRGDPGMVPVLAKRLLGSPDVYQKSGRAAYHSINFVTCHDGFTLADLVSYNTKHNKANGEEERDGTDDNLSWNCGWEGPTSALEPGVDRKNSLAEVEAIRRRQIRNFAAILLLSRGVPMILAGDEMVRTQLGNNNAYCQDNEISWVDWSLINNNTGLLRFFRQLIKFRKRHPALMVGNFTEQEGKPDFPVTWHGVKPGKPDWSWESRSLAVQILEKSEAPAEGVMDIYISFNAYWEPLKLELPELGGNRKWFRVVDTMLESPHDISEQGKESLLDNQGVYEIGPRAAIVLIGK
jgi:isoamylase